CGRAEMRLLRTAPARHRRSEEPAHPAVSDDRATALEAFEESVVGLRGGHFALLRLRSTHPPGLARPGLAPCSSSKRLPRRRRAGSLSLSRCGAGRCPLPPTSLAKRVNRLSQPTSGDG